MPAWPLSQCSETEKKREQSQRRDLTARTTWTLEVGLEREERTWRVYLLSVKIATSWK